MNSAGARSLDGAGNNEVATTSASSVAASGSSSHNNWGKALLVGAGVLVGAVAVAAIGIGALIKHLKVWRS